MEFAAGARPRDLDRSTAGVTRAVGAVGTLGAEGMVERGEHVRGRVAKQGGDDEPDTDPEQVCPRVVKRPTRRCLHEGHGRADVQLYQRHPPRAVGATVVVVVVVVVVAVVVSKWWWLWWW